MITGMLKFYKDLIAKLDTAEDIGYVFGVITRRMMDLGMSGEQIKQHIDRFENKYAVDNINTNTAPSNYEPTHNYNLSEVREDNITEKISAKTITNPSFKKLLAPLANIKLVWK